MQFDNRDIESQPISDLYKLLYSTNQTVRPMGARTYNRLTTDHKNGIVYTDSFGFNEKFAIMNIVFTDSLSVRSYFQEDLEITGCSHISTYLPLNFDSDDDQVSLLCKLLTSINFKSINTPNPNGKATKPNNTPDIPKLDKNGTRSFSTVSDRNSDLLSDLELVVSANNTNFILTFQTHSQLLTYLYNCRLNKE